MTRTPPTGASEQAQGYGPGHGLVGAIEWQHELLEIAAGFGIDLAAKRQQGVFEAM